MFGSRWFGFRAVVLRVKLLVWPIGNVFGPLDRSLLWEKNALLHVSYFFLSLFVLKVSTLIGSLIGLNETWILYCLKENKTLSYDKAIVYYSGNYSPRGCVDNIVLGRMSVRSLPVAGKFDRENVRKSTSEAGINPLTPVPAETGRAKTHPQFPVPAVTGRKKACEDKCLSYPP